MTWYRCILSFIIGGTLLFFYPGCSKKTDSPVEPIVTSPVVTTAGVTSVLSDKATCGGTVTSDGGAAVTVRGICWSLLTGPQITDQYTADGAGTGLFISQMNNLIPDTLYYVRAYATNSKGTSYGNVQQFRTLKPVFNDVTDIDGNNYPVVKIGMQYWLKKNLLVTHYRNGDPIPQVTVDAQWKILTSGAFCCYDNLGINVPTYGNLYNWHALNDNRGLCPEGWHVPSLPEWETLGNFLGGYKVAGGKLKSPGTIEESSGLWYSPNADATNSTGFSGLPGGYRINYGTYYSLGNVGYFWSASDTASVNAWTFILDANNGELKRNYNFMTNGFSVRCCRD